MASSYERDLQISEKGRRSSFQGWEVERVYDFAWLKTRE
jgi:hypothetical protein